MSEYWKEQSMSGQTPSPSREPKGSEDPPAQTERRLMSNRLTEHFYRTEATCKCGCGFAAVDIELVMVLEKIRDHFGGNPLRITSWCRCGDHNRNIGGAKGSFHVMGMAVDFLVEGVHADTVADYLEDTYPNCYGVGRYVGRTHFDIRPIMARWDNRGKRYGNH